MNASGIYTVKVESVSDRSLASLLEALLIESMEAEPRPCADCPPSCGGSVAPAD